MKSKTQSLIDRLSVGPAFLLLGQATWALQDGVDPVYASASARADDPGDRGDLSSLRVLESGERTAFFARLADTSTHAVFPPAVERIARHAWNGVFTSLIDSRVSRVFEADWRRVTTIAGSDGEVRNPRSPSELKVRLLFGGVNLPEEQRPPTDELSFALRAQEAVTSLNELGRDLITPRGVVVIEGYRRTDWLEPSQLFAFLGQLLPGQAHLFSANEELLADSFIAGAIDRGLLTPHEASLSATLDEAESTGRLLRPAGVDAEARVVRIGGSLIEVPRDVWNGVVSVARPIDEGLLQPIGPASQAVRYQQFRSFLGASEGAPPWSAIAAGFHFHREFEQGLWSDIQTDASESLVPEPLILEGQTASGKTTAMAATAIRAAREGSLAALYVSSRGTRPHLAAIDRYASWAAEHGALGTLLLWDGMADPDDYFGLHRQLQARGRRVSIVGTNYLTPGRTRRKIVAPSRLTEDEAQQLGPWLESFGVRTTADDLDFIAEYPSFLAALYRLLPDSRRKVQRGLSLELRSAEAHMEQMSRDQRDADPDEGLTAMAAALRQAGVDIPAFLPRDTAAEVDEIAFSERSTAERLTAIVIVAGRRNLRVPLELAMRVLGRAGSTSIIEVIKQFDIIRWSDDESGEQYLGSRNALEAELLAQMDLRDAKSEIDVIAALLRDLRPRPGIGGPEVEFAVDLLGRIGPESPDGARFVSLYPDIVRALRELRSRPGGAHPRLVLYEANFSRKWVMWAQERDESSPDDRLEVLAEAAQLLENSLPEVTHARTRLNLLVESASVLGAQAFELSKRDANPAVLQELARQVVERTSEARALDPENFYPIDVVVWVVLRLVGGGDVSRSQRADLTADALASIVGLDKGQLSARQQAKYDSRLAQLAGMLGDEDLEAAHLEQLAQNNDPAAYFLLALNESGLLRKEFDESGARLALQRLRDAPDVVRDDWRCARLLLDLFWLVKTGQRLLQGQRESLAFSRSDWEECIAIVRSAAGLAESDRYRADFLLGLAYFHLGQINQSMAVFEQLQRTTTALSRRVVSTYLVSSPDGAPRHFTGQVRTVRADGSGGLVWVDQLGVELPFIPRRFSVELPARNDPLPEFQIAFNMRGPFADPIRSAPGSLRRGHE